jgi:muramoyltetrapeptide carboxypeptidase
VRRPLPLRPGDPIAVAAPASAPRDLSRYREGLDRLGALYDIRTAWTAGRQRGYLSAPDPVRAAELNEAVADESIRAIVCVRGGYGSLRLLSHLDWAAAREHPTLLVGYSDITALHLAYFARAGWTGLSGPVVTEWPKLRAAGLKRFRTLVEGGLPSPADSLQSLRPGEASGPLLGGNLSVLSRLLGTAYAPDWEGALLVLEDVGEAPYRIDRMLAHLQHAGALDAVAGVILGSFRQPESPPDPTLSLDTVFRDYFGARRYPVATGFEYGHLWPRQFLPLGVSADLSVTEDGASLSLNTPLTRSPDAAA